DRLRLDPERLAAVRDALLAVLAVPGGGDAPLVVRDDDQDRQRIGRPRRPYQAGGEIPLRGSGVAAGDDGDSASTGALLRDACPDADRVLRLDDGADRNDVPLALRVVIRKVAASRIRVGGRVLHLAERVDRLGA